MEIETPLKCKFTIEFVNHGKREKEREIWMG